MSTATLSRPPAGRTTSGIGSLTTNPTATALLTAAPPKPQTNAPPWFQGLLTHCRRVNPGRHPERIELDLSQAREAWGLGAIGKNGKVQALQLELAVAYMDTHYDRIDLAAALQGTVVDNITGGHLPSLILARTGNLNGTRRSCVIETPTMSLGQKDACVVNNNLTFNPPEMALGNVSRMYTGREQQRGRGTGYQVTWTFPIVGKLPADVIGTFNRLGFNGNGGGTTTTAPSTGTGTPDAGTDVIGGLRSAGAVSLIVAPQEGVEVTIGDPAGIVTLVLSNGTRVSWRVTDYFDMEKA